MDLRLFILQRALSLFIVLVGASLLIFLVLRVLPGDPIASIVGFDASGETIERYRRELGIDRPVPVQYWMWLQKAVTGDFGDSLVFKMSVDDMLFDRFPRTLLLASVAMLIAFAIAIPTGVLAATHKSGAIDHLSRLVALVGVSMPNFWLGLLLIFFFGVTLRWLPPGGFVSPLESPLGALQHILLPAVTLGTAYAGTIMRMLRSSMLDVLGRDYVLVARSVGVPRQRIVWHDAFRNALVPTLTVSGFAFGYMLAGTILTEVIFNIPGVGRLLYEAILNRDYPLVQGIVLFNVTLFVLINFAVDVLYSVLDPRIRY